MARTSLSYLPVVLVLVMMNTIVIMMMMSKDSLAMMMVMSSMAMMMMSRGSLAKDPAMGVGSSLSVG